MFGAAGTRFRAIPDRKISKKNLGPKNVFFDQRKPPDRPGPGKTKIEKFWPDELPARQPAAGTGPG